jgi:hypothetical protein
VNPDDRHATEYAMIVLGNKIQADRDHNKERLLNWVNHVCVPLILPFTAIAGAALFSLFKVDSLIGHILLILGGGALGLFIGWVILILLPVHIPVKPLGEITLIGFENLEDFGSIPARVLVEHGQASRLVHEAAVNYLQGHVKDAEVLDTVLKLSDQWSGSIDELIGAARTLTEKD